MSNAVPEGWGSPKLGEIFKLHRESVEPIDYPEEKFDYYSIPALDEHGSYETVTGKEIQSNKTVLSKPTILVSKLNPRKPRVMLADGESANRRCASTEFMPYVSTTTSCYLGFYKWYLESDLFHNRLQLVATGSTNSHVRVTPSETLRWCVPEPPLPEQQKIAAILSSVDDVIEKTQAQIDKLKDLKTGMMQELLTKGIGHTEFKDSPVGRIPVGWDVVQFREIFEEYKYGPRFSSKDYATDGNVKTIRGTDVSTNGEIHYQQVPVAQIDDKTVSAHTLQEGDLVMITTADCGVSAVFRDQGFPYIASAYAIKLTPKDSLAPEFIKFYMQTPLALKQVESFVRKGTVANLPGSDVMTIKLGLPPRVEQEKIASILNSLDDKIRLTTEKLGALTNTKKALMQDLLTGTVRVKVD